MTRVPAAATSGPLVDGVLFDIDDTLVDTRHAFGRAIDAVARVYLPGLPEERRPEAVAMWRSDPNGHFRAYTRGEVDFETQRLRRARELQAAFGGEPLDEVGYREWLELFWGTYMAAWAAFGDARSSVDRLRAAGLRIGALTNAAAELQTQKLTHAGLGDVPVLVGVDTLGVGKPDPRVFLEACRRLGTEPSRTAYVGDEQDIDAGGAAAAGLIGVWLDRPATRRGGWYLEDEEAARAAGLRVIGSLDELPMALGVTART